MDENPPKNQALKMIPFIPKQNHTCAHTLDRYRLHLLTQKVPN